MKNVKKVQMRKMVALCLAGSMLVVLTGCGGAASFQNASTDSAPMEKYEYSMDVGGSYFTEDALMEESVEVEYAESGTTATNTADGGTQVDEGAAVLRSERKLIKTVDMTVETKEFDLLMSTLEQQVNALGGYIENMDTYNGSAYSYYRSTRNASMTIRIPKDKLNGFLETVSDICNVVRRSENVEDVTLAYVDLESHKNALRTEQTRLLELLEKAESIEDILVIERRLSEVRYELESMESQLRTYDNKVDYSTVYLAVDEVEELTPVEEESAGERMVNGFRESLSDIGEGLKEFGIGFVIHIPYLVIWGMIAVVVFFAVRGLCRKRKNRKAVKNGKNESASGASETLK